jgi:hypothetical protein
VKIYRVTEVLDPYSDYDRIPEETMEAAKARGTAVHLHLKCYALGLWSPRPEQYAGYCESGERWLDGHVKRVISAEEEYRYEALGYLGHLDLVADTDMGIMVVDYKTPATEAKTWGLQLAAYRHLAIERHKFRGCKCGALMLHPEGGNARLRFYDEKRDYFFSLFMGLLNAARYFKEEK